MKSRRPLHELRFRDDAGPVVAANRPLIFATIRRVFPGAMRLGWEMLESLEAVGLMSLAKAHRDHDATKGKYSTLAVTYLTNDLANELNRHSRRVRRVKSCVVLVGNEVERREMRPDVAAVTRETIQRNSTGSLFSDESY